MVASWASSRGHIGLTGAPPACGGCGGGAPCARASIVMQSRAAPARIDRETETLKVSGISSHSSTRLSRRQGGLALAASRGSVTSFPGRRCGGASRWFNCRTCRDQVSALARDGDILAAAGTRTAIAAGFGNRARHFIGIDPPIGGGLDEIPRLTIGPRGMGAAFLAVGETLVDAIAVGLIGDDEDAAVGRCRRYRRNEQASQECREGSHDSPMNERTASFDRPKWLTIINHGAVGLDHGQNPPQRGPCRPKKGRLGLDAVPSAVPWCRNERSPRHLWHLPRDYELAIRWLRPSFLT